MKYFGTDGIRMKAEKFTSEFVFRVTDGLLKYTESLGFEHTPKVLIGGDTRESSEWILQDLAAALETLGFEYASVGVLPTPAINYCFFEMGFDFAIDVTASHNPYNDNGIKIFERGTKAGVKLSEQGCKTIEGAILSEETYALASTSDREDLHDEAVRMYVTHLLEYTDGANLAGLKIGMDFANGAMSAIGGQAFTKLGAEVIEINNNASYGQGINAGCGSTHLEELCELVAAQNLDFGVAYDGDGDRCLMIDGEGEVVDGDEIIAILVRDLELDAMVVTVMANQGLLDFAKKNSIRTEITAVGDSNVAEAMRECGILIGGEQSGHIILPGEPTGDGMLTALTMARAVKNSGKTLDELKKVMMKLPQVMVNMAVNAKQKENLKTLEPARKLLLEYDEKLKGVSGRLLVRPSGTEPLIRITMWGNDESKIVALAEELKNKLGEVL